MLKVNWDQSALPLHCSVANRRLFQMFWAHICSYFQSMCPYVVDPRDGADWSKHDWDDLLQRIRPIRLFMHCTMQSNLAA